MLRPPSLALVDAETPAPHARCCNGRVHLDRLEVSNFRSCRGSTFWFQPDLTVLVGENNSGKSNVVDAIRLVTAPSDGRRTRYCESSDVSFHSPEPWFDIRAIYADLSMQKQAMFLAASNGVGTAQISYRLRYDIPGPHERRGLNTWTVGANDASDPEPTARDRIRHVFLPPLRDAPQALASGSGDRIEFIMRALATAGEVEAFEASAIAAFDSLGTDPLLTRANGQVSAQLTSLSRGSIPHQSKLAFSEPNLRQLARALRTRIGEVGLDPADLAHSGLGYANLLFLATVVVELEATHDADLTVFLVEEPEAHLHPQLQTAVLDFLSAAARHDVETPGEVQVVVTTHSAQLAASVSASHLAVIKAPAIPECDPPERRTVAIPAWMLNVPDEHRRKVDRYINATRSPLLFGPRVLLVEGIAEALLLPPIARRVLSDEAALSRFRGLALVAIDGVDFEPYIRLLLSPHQGVCMAERVVVITDKDPSAPGDRVASLVELAQELGALQRLHVEAADITLEASLFSAGNESCLHDAFIAQRPQSQHVWDDLLQAPEAERPAAFVKLVHDKRISKGDMAQYVARVVESEAPFTVPGYLQAAIIAATE